MRNYEKIYSSFEWSYPEHFNFARDVIDKWAEIPDKLAIVSVDEHGREDKRSYQDISIASKKLCNVLTAAGVARGDTIVLLMGRHIAWWESLTAALRMGAIASPGTTQLSSGDLAYRINASKASCVITDNVNAGKLEEIASECPSLKTKLIIGTARDGWIDYQQSIQQASEDFATVDTASDEEALCYFTSGTTGYPKMVIHSHSYGLGHQTTGKYWLNLKEDDLHWNISDTGWAKAAWSSFFGPWHCGAAVFIHDVTGFNAVDTLLMFAKYPITTMCGAPTIYRMLVLEDLSQYKFHCLRHCVGAGEPLNPEVIEVWKKATGLTIRDGYGQTETVILCGNFPGVEPRFGSMGKPAPGIDLRVIDDHCEVMPVNAEGDIAVKAKPIAPQGLFKGYKGDPEKTADSFRGNWYITGDRAYVDEDGYFWFVSRADDVILSSGYRIGPFEVESALLEHESVAESAVVSSPDQKRGEIVKAFIVLKEGFEGSSELGKVLQDHVKNITAPYKYPRKIEFVKQLPKTVSGKIRRIELRESEWRGAP